MGINNLALGGDVTFDDSVVITGNLTVNGDFVKQNVETVEIQDNLLLINFGETGPGVTAGYAGNEIDRGTANPYRWGFNEVNDSFEVGEYFEKATGTLSGAFTLHEEVIQATTLARGYVFAQDGGSISLKGTTGTFNSSDIITGQTSTETVTSPTMSVTDSLQPIATREDTPTDTAIAFWDTATARFVTDSNLVWDGGTFTVTTAVSSEGVVCGKGYVGNPTTAANAVVLSHKNLKATASAYAIYQSNVGASHVNSASGQNFSFSIAGATRGSLMSNGDWQFRGTTNNNLLYTDYSEHRVGVNTDVPDALFDVAGISRAESFACENYIDIFEQTVPANPAADVGRLYVKDNSGTTTLYFRDNAGSETDLLSFAGATDVESATKSDSYTITDSDSARVFYLSGAAANKIFTLPTAADNTDKEFLFINLDSADELQIKGESTETLDFDGVQQNTIDIELKNNASLICLAPVEIRVNNRFECDNDTYVGPAVASDYSAKDVVIYVGGVDAAIDEQATEIDIGSIIKANIYSPNGTLYIEDDCQIEGSFIGKDVEIGIRTTVTLDSAFVTTSNTCDFENDGDVDGKDLSAFTAAFTLGASTADVNNDGTVNAADVGEFAGHFGEAGTGAAAPPLQSIAGGDAQTRETNKSPSKSKRPKFVSKKLEGKKENKKITPNNKKPQNRRERKK